MGASAGIRRESAHLRRAVALVPLEVRAVMRAEGAALKRTLQREASGVEHAPGLPAAITMSSGMKPEPFYEVGPVGGGSGSLALLYYGNSNTGSVLKDPRFALLRQAEQTTAKLTQIVVRLG